MYINDVFEEIQCVVTETETENTMIGIITLCVVYLSSISLAQDLQGDTPDSLKCRFGRLQWGGNHCSPWQPTCCLRNNPCRNGDPFRVNRDAISCGWRRCPWGYRCQRGRGYSVCCPRSSGGSSIPMCPNVFCTLQLIEPWYCRRERYSWYRGGLCRLCPINICTRG